LRLVVSFHVGVVGLGVTFGNDRDTSTHAVFNHQIDVGVGDKIYFGCGMFEDCVPREGGKCEKVETVQSVCVERRMSKMLKNVAQE